MEVLLANHSSYPRIGPHVRDQRLRRAHAARERGEIDDSALLAIEYEMMTELVVEQAAGGLDLVTDGQVRWSDAVSHLMRAIPGVRIDGLLRFFDTNFYFRQPVVSRQVTSGPCQLERDFRHAAQASPVPVKAILTGPYTLARLSLVQPPGYRRYQDLAEDLAVVLSHEVRALVAAGARLIQIDEPAICFGGHDDVRLLRRLFEPLYEARGEARLAIATYFADADPLYPQLHSIPVDVVALDLTTSARLHESIACAGAAKVLALGVVDGRNSRIEAPGLVARQLEQMLRRYTLDTIYLQPSCGLEFLPRDRARQKLDCLAAIRHDFLARDDQ
jgi:5-methyltetrahydropteroyltriglutamate--homocysteine methyltransferase